MLVYFTKDMDFTRQLFFTEKGEFNMGVVVGLTAVYTLAYTAHENKRKEEIEIIHKPRIARNSELLNDMTRYLVLSTNITTNINITLGDQLYNYYADETQSKKKTLSDEISESYKEFKILRDKLLLLVRLTKDADLAPACSHEPTLEKYVESLHDNIKQSVSEYHLIQNRLANTYSKRESMTENPSCIAAELSSDPGKPGNYIHTESKNAFVNNFKPLHNAAYNHRSNIRDLVALHLTSQQEKNFF